MKKLEIICPLIDAIANPVDRDEVIDYKIVYFEKLPAIYKINGLELRRYINPEKTEIYYGLMDIRKDTHKLAGILQLEKVKVGWQVRLAQMNEPYKSQGYASFMYDYAVMNDKLTLLSDTSQTEGGAGGSKGLWTKLYRQGRFTVAGYNTDTGEIISLDDSSDIAAKIYNQKENILWIAFPRAEQETINEMLQRVNLANQHRHIEWYGAGIIDG